jgi:translation initiation factor IF-2
VDHGKTTLIDNLRSTNNVSQEAGGITQQNSIFQHTILQDSFKFTIVDTPGHAAFSKMRATGTVLTDIAILVVDAAEGVKPQTRECIQLLKDNDVPIVVALNKIDLPKSNIDMCYEMLFEEGIETEQIGGNVPSVPISALQGTNVLQLMQTVKKVSDTLNLNAVTQGVMEGVLFDIKPDRRKQIVSTLLIRKGCISKGDTIVTDTHVSNVRELLSIDGERLKIGMPGMPVKVIGPQEFSRNLAMGSTIYSIKKAKNISKRKAHVALINKLQSRILDIVREEKIFKSLPYGKKKISFLLCADSTSTLEILQQMLDIETDEVTVNVFSSSVKFLTVEQIKLAETINAQIVLFNVKPLNFETTAVVHHFDIIYHLAAAINKAIDESLPPNINRVITGKGVIAEIHGSKQKRVAGVNKLTGKFSLGMNFKITRSGFEVWSGALDSLRYVRSSILETSSNMTECGVSFSKHSVPDLVVGDVIECYYSERVQRILLNEKFYGQNQEDQANFSASD